MQRLLESIEGRSCFPAPDPALQVRQGPGNPRIRSQWTARSPSGGSTIRRNRFAVLGPRSTSEGPPRRSREDSRPRRRKTLRASLAQFRTRKAASGESAPVLLQGPSHSVPRTRNHISGDKRECRNTIPRTSNPGRTHSYIARSMGTPAVGAGRLVLPAEGLSTRGGCTKTVRPLRASFRNTRVPCSTLAPRPPGVRTVG
jgi:hypothetical protein